VISHRVPRLVFQHDLGLISVLNCALLMLHSCVTLIIHVKPCTFQMSYACSPNGAHLRGPTPFLPPIPQIWNHAFEVKDGKGFIRGRNIGLGGLICGGILQNLDEHPLVLWKMMRIMVCSRQHIIYPPHKYL
jgi:hypothetical protein